MATARTHGGSSSPALTSTTSAGATIYSVAEHAASRIATVSRVLQGAGTVSAKTAQKVLDAVEELNYVPLGAARSLAVRHHEAHGSRAPRALGPYYSELLIGLRVARCRARPERDADAHRGQGRHRPRGAPARHHVDAIAVFGSAAMPPAVARALHGRSLSSSSPAHPRTVSSASALRTPTAPSSSPSTCWPTAAPRLVFVGDPGGAPDINELHAGFVAAHRARGSNRPSRSGSPSARGRARPSPNGSSPARSTPMPSSAPTTKLALAVMTHLQDAGRDVPGDIAVVGGTTS